MLRLLVMLAAILCHCGAVNCPRDTLRYREGDFDPFYRLPLTLRPTEYDLRFHFDPSADFDVQQNASAAINILAVEDTDTVIVHWGRYESRIVARPVLLRLKDNATFTAVNVTSKEATKQTLELTFGVTLKKGEAYKLQFKHQYVVPPWAKWSAHSMREEGHLIATQFQPTWARYVFPCFDDPLFKAVFNIRIYVPTNYTSQLSVRSNMRLEKRMEQENGETEFLFGPTPPMAAYLVALSVTNTSLIKGSISLKQNNFEIEAFGSEDNETLLDHADLAADTFKAMEIYTGIPSPIKFIQVNVVPEHRFK